MVGIERIKQSLQDHGICYVQDLELVDTEDQKVLRKIIPYERNCVACFPLEFLVNLVLLLMDFEHELLVVEKALSTWI